MFVTCFYAVLDPEDGTLRYANAGHDPPYMRRVGGDAEELRARGMPLGLMPSMSYEEQGASLREGESVLFYSDGLVEAHDPEGQMFSFPRLRALISELGVEESAGGFPDGGARTLHRGGVGAGGRHDTLDAEAFRIPKLNFLERRTAEVRLRRISLLGTSVNKVMRNNRGSSL
jgi:Stage II sporulation protein E (SpoIIE)